LTSKKYLKQIFFLLAEEKKKIPGLVVLFIIASIFDVIGIGLVGPYLALVVDNTPSDNAVINWFIQKNISGNYDTILIILGSLLVLVFLIKATASIIINRKILIFANQQVVRLRTRLMEIYQNMPYTDHIQRNSSDYIQATQGYTAQFIGIIITLTKWICEGIAAISIFILLIYSQGLIPILLVITIGIIIYLYNVFFSPIVKKAGEIAPIQNSRAIKGISESIEGFKEIKTLGIENYFTRKVHDASQIFSEQRCKEQIIAFAPRQIFESVIIFFIVTLVVSSLLMGNNTDSIIPAIGMFGVATARLLPSTTIFARGLTTLQYSRYGISVLYNDVKKYGSNKRIKTRSTNGIENSNKFKDFKLINVSYKYPGSTINSLQNISINIKQGESIGIIGSSGAGKTTMIDLILGLLVPEQGSLLYNGSPLNEDMDKWKSKIAYIPQQIFLIDDTLRRNVALGEDDAIIDEKKIMEAITQSQLSTLINELPLGLDTVLGERGVRLSGGQRQRVALARAFYYGREVFVMDEATSALDTKTEKQIVAEINRLKNQKTIIVIAHRLSTVKTCDMIYKIEKGKIVSADTPSKMLAVETSPL